MEDQRSSTVSPILKIQQRDDLMHLNLELIHLLFTEDFFYFYALFPCMFALFPNLKK